MANDKHCDKCGGFEFKDGSCGKCGSENGVVDQNNKFEGKKQQKNLQNSFRTVDSLNFANTLIKAKQGIQLDRRWRVDVHDISDYDDDKLFVSDGGSCVAIEPNGNIISVCKNPNDFIIAGADLLRHAVENGGDRLDAFGDYLYGFYTRNGFMPVSWTPFNKEYAPFEWREAKNRGLDVKEEPIIFYKYTGAVCDISYEDFLKNTAPYEGEDGYDKAEKARNERIKDEVQKQ